MKINIKLFDDFDEENLDVVFRFGEKERRTIFAPGTWYRDFRVEMRYDFEKSPNKDRIRKVLDIRFFGSLVYDRNLIEKM